MAILDGLPMPEIHWLRTEEDEWQSVGLKTENASTDERPFDPDRNTEKFVGPQKVELIGSIIDTVHALAALAVLVL